MALTFTWPGGKSKALVMSYDDGCVQDKRLLEIFNRYGIKGTFHIPSGSAFAESHISLSDMKSVYAGHEISCHTVSHPYLERIAVSEMIREIWSDRETLEKAAGTQIRGMSYPMRNYTPEIIEICKAAGIQYARTADSTGKFNLPADFMRWDPTCHHTEAMKYLEPFRKLESYRKLSLFFVWGHSFELDRDLPDNNWEMMESFCQQAAEIPDVWFATCMEVCRYVNAVRNAEVSCDGKNVYNPSAETLYLEHEQKQLLIAPGETVYL